MFDTYAQNSPYYYYKGEKVYLEIDKSKLYITANSNFDETSIQITDVNEINITDDSNSKKGSIVFNSELSILEYYQKSNILLNNPNIANISHYFKRGEAESIGISNIFYIKLKDINDLTVLQQHAIQNNVSFIHQNQFMPLWCKLEVNPNNPKTSLQLSNEFYETGLFDDVDPAFMFNFKTDCTNDEDFDQQWGLYNAFDPNVDINICDAWGITEGNGVNVAVLDNGIYKSHNDLSGNISSLSYDANSGSSPSIFINGLNHGTHVAGVIGALKDNNLQIVGVAPQSNIISVSHDFQIPNNEISEEFADGINWAWQNGADVINNSWSDQGGLFYDLFQSAILENAIDNALSQGRNGLGTVLIFTAGNENSAIGYPASYHPDILCVGAIMQSGARAPFSSFGAELDIVAPGKDILLLDPFQGTKFDDGTSFAAPHVSGLAALIISAIPCISGKLVNDIIEQTAQKVGNYTYNYNTSRPNGDWNNEMGYGLIDAYAAVQMAQNMASPTLDLFVKDNPEDVGVEPNPTSQNMWTSDDIWIRNVDDNGLTHQNPEYKTPVTFGGYTFTPPSYIYVRVINKSCVSSTGTETLNVNWAKANTALFWPDNWDGSLQNENGYVLGEALPSVNIPVLGAGEEVIVKVPWEVPDPNHYNDNENPWHFCLLARIDSYIDQTGALTSNPNIMVREYNNMAWKNISVVDLEENLMNVTVMVSNPYNYTKRFSLELYKQNNVLGKAIYEEAEVTITMDDVLFNAWEKGGKVANELESTIYEKSKRIKNNNVLLDNIEFEPKEMGLLTLDFNFLTEELTDKSEFIYHMVQKDAVTGEIIGGEKYIIRKNVRPLFFADAGEDKEVNLNETIIISAEDINEPAIYNWYDSDGNLVHQGKDLTVVADVVKEYELEVIATSDGFKDYTDVEVKFKPSFIESISPNPSSNFVTINYKANNVTSAYLMILGYYGSNTSYNYILDINSQQTQIDVSLYNSGYYTVALVCDGLIMDAKTLLKQ